MLTNLIRERYLQLNCPQTQYKILQLQTSERIGGERGSGRPGSCSAYPPCVHVGVSDEEENICPKLSWWH